MHFNIFAFYSGESLLCRPKHNWLSIPTHSTRFQGTSGDLKSGGQSSLGGWCLCSLLRVISMFVPEVSGCLLVQKAPRSINCEVSSLFVSRKKSSSMSSAPAKGGKICWTFTDIKPAVLFLYTLSAGGTGFARAYSAPPGPAGIGPPIWYPGGPRLSVWLWLSRTSPLRIARALPILVLLESRAASLYDNYR